MMCLVKSLFGIKTINKLGSVNARLIVHLLFMMYNHVRYIFSLKIETMVLEIQIFNVEKKHDEVHNMENKAENKQQIKNESFNSLKAR